MSHTICSKVFAIGVDTPDGQLVTAFGLMSSSNIWSLDNKSHPKHWGLIAIAYGEDEFQDRVASYADGIRSGSFKLYGIKGGEGYMDLALAGFAKLSNLYGSAVKVEANIPGRCGWNDDAVHNLTHAANMVRYAKYGYHGDTIEVNLTTVSTYLDAEIHGHRETMKALKAFRGRPYRDFFGKDFANLIMHLQVYGNLTLLRKLFHHDRHLDFNDEAGLHPIAVSWHVIRLIKEAHGYEGVQELFNALPAMLSMPSEEILDAIEQKAAEQYTSVEDACLLMELRAGGYKKICDDALSERSAKAAVLRATLEEQAASKIVACARNVADNAWFTNTGRLVKNVLKGEYKTLKEKIEGFGISPEFNENLLKDLQNALFTIERRREDHIMGARHNNRKGHASAAKQLERASEMFRVYLPA